MKMKLASTLLISALSAVTYASGKHVHGEAALFIAIENKKVLIELESPADNILGFEHAPSTNAQKQHLQNRLALLGQYKNVLTLSDGAACQQTESHIDSPFNEQKRDHHGSDHKDDHHGSDHKDDHHGSDHKDDHHGSDHKDDHHGSDHKDDHHGSDHKDDHHGSGHKDDDHNSDHSDFHVTYSLTCSNVESVNSIQVTAFELFKNFTSIKVNWVTSDQQGSAEVSKNKTEVLFK